MKNKINPIIWFFIRGGSIVLDLLTFILLYSYGVKLIFCILLYIISKFLYLSYFLNKIDITTEDLFSNSSTILEKIKEYSYFNSGYILSFKMILFMFIYFLPQILK